MAKIRGAKELRAAIKRAPKHLRDEATKEVRASTRRMHRHARELFNSAAQFAPLYHGGPGMQNITGLARSLYRYSLIDRGMRGRVGLLSASSESRGYYLRIFLSGSEHQPARPVHDVAFEAERDTFLVNQRRALGRVLEAMG